MSGQDHYWSRAAGFYEREFVDPYREDVRDNPLISTLEQYAGPTKAAADLGCGIGPLLPTLARLYGKVYAVDFAAGMLERARAAARGHENIDFVQASLTDLPPFAQPLDVAAAVNSLVLPHPADLDKALAGIHRSLGEKGVFLGIFPAMDSIHYYTMLLVDRALRSGKPLAAARKNAAAHADHELFDFAFSQFHFKGLEQHFCHPDEIRYRLKKAGFRLRKLKRILLSWEQFAFGNELADQTPPWDWFFLATKT